METKSLFYTKLNQDEFENAISVGLKMNEILTLFGKSGKEMDKWCGEVYGTPQFFLVYETVKQKVLAEYLACLKKLALRGNNTALNIVEDVLRGSYAEQTVKIVFDTKSMKEETEQDKRNDG